MIRKCLSGLAARNPVSRRTSLARRDRFRRCVLALDCLEDRTMLSVTFSNLSAPTITYGTASQVISGQLNSNSANPIPAGETVTVTLNGLSQTATLSNTNGNSDDFSTTFTTATLPVSVLPYPISFSYAGDANFSSASATSTLTVNTATLTISAVNQTFTYGSSIDTYAFTSSGLQGSDSISGVTLVSDDGTSTSGYYEVTSSPATITASAAVFSSGSSSNYSITYASAPIGLTVTPAPLTVTGISGTDKIADGTTNDPLTGTPSLSGLVSGDNVTLGGTGVGTLASAGPGSEPVTVTGVPPATDPVAGDTFVTVG